MGNPSLRNTSVHFFSSAASNTVSQSIHDFISLCNKGSLGEAFQKFKSLLWSQPSLFSHLLRACLPTQSLCQAQQLHSLIVTSGCSSDKFISNHLLNLYSKCGDLVSADTLFRLMPKKNTMSSNILLGGYLTNGFLEAAHKLFDAMPERNVATWNAMLTSSVQIGLNEQGLELFCQMRREALRPDEFTLGSVLRGCAGLRVLEFGKGTHGCAIKHGLHLHLAVGSSLAHMYMKCGRVGEGERVIEWMPTWNVVAFNTVITGRAQNGFAEAALDQFYLMKTAGLRPDQITFVSVISSCAELATLGQGQQVHAQAIKAGVDCEVSVRSSLVNMYAKCGCLEDSKAVFTESVDFDIVLWSSMIGAYGFHGCGHEAIMLFERMESEGMEPNDVTFLDLLYACSHSGLKDKGTYFFNLMMEKYEIQPRLEHYTCMVDLLARAGFLGEAECLIRSMPIKPDGVIWKTLLSACKIHKNEEMARSISEDVLKLDPEDSAPYVLLSNIHASKERWGEVLKVRKAMKDRKVKKEPGISWFEVKNEVHQFRMGDQSHPRWREIDVYLKDLTARMRESGYVPDNASVLHDMEDEEKEHSLVHHSEKLAIAFALLTTQSGTPIRIMKNLRVCNDCHVAIKFISTIAKREVIVRDASRFHHFKEGLCSCGDYW